MNFDGEDEILTQPAWKPIARVYSVTALREQLAQAKESAAGWRDSYYAEAEHCDRLIRERDEALRARDEWREFGLGLARDNEELAAERDLLASTCDQLVAALPPEAFDAEEEVVR